jgi:hypothetical protein
MGDVRASLLSVPNYDTLVKDLTYKDLLTSTFTLTSHERGIKTWCVPTTCPECVYCDKWYRYERFNVECHIDPNIVKATGKERTVTPYKESLTLCGPHRKRFLEVQTEIHTHMVDLVAQLLTWAKQPCAWARELFLERGTLLCHIVIHSF